MRIKKFQAENMASALQLVREELGDNALILSTKKIHPAAGGGMEGIEMVAAADESVPVEPNGGDERNRQNAQLDLPTPGKRNYASRLYAESLHPTTPEPVAAFSRASAPAFHEQDPSRSFLQESDRGATALPFLHKLRSSLQISGVHGDIVDRIIGHLSISVPQNRFASVSTASETLRETLAGHIRASYKMPPQNDKPYVIALVGPTGVGKTTSLAKIAARLKIDHHLDVGLISIDTFRIAAIDQLRTFAHIAEMPLAVAYAAPELVAALQRFSGLDVILIDTTGRSPRNQSYIDELRKFLEAAKPDEVHLTLSASTRFAEMEEIAQQFLPLEYNRLLPTKIDEIMHPAILLNMTKISPAALAYVTNGQNIPDDIVMATSEALTSLIVDAWDLHAWIN